MTEECLRVVQRTANVIELSLVASTVQGDCSRLIESESSFSLLFFTQSDVSCPNYIGRFVFQSEASDTHRGKSSLISLGCARQDKLSIAHENRLDGEHRSIVQNDTCLASWQSDNASITYFLAQSAYSNASYCLVRTAERPLPPFHLYLLPFQIFHMTDPMMIQNNSRTCALSASTNDRSLSTFSTRRQYPCAAPRSRPHSNALLWSLTLLVSFIP